MTEYDNVNFRGSNYEYQIQLGTVTGTDCIGWHSNVYCKEWTDVERLVDAWQDSRDNPAVEIRTAYRPTADHKNAE